MTAGDRTELEDMSRPLSDAARLVLGAAADVAADRAKFGFSLDDACARLGLDADEVRRLGAGRHGSVPAGRDILGERRADRCNKWMPRAQAQCVRRTGHPGPCRRSP